MLRADWLICQGTSKFVARQVVNLMKNEQQSQNLLLKVDPRSTFRDNFLQPATNVLGARQVVTQGEKRETSTKTCNETMLRNKLKVFVSRISPPLVRTRYAHHASMVNCHARDKVGIDVINYATKMKAILSYCD